jgi:hypothetical protein
MELKEFMEKFLPNCEERRKEAKTVGECLYFNTSNFPEALRNFADCICKEQRRICGNKIFINRITRQDTSEREMNTTGQPKIEEL